MKHFTITVTGTIDAPGETNADIAQGIRERVEAIGVQGGKLVTEIASISRLTTAALVVESRGGDHQPAEVISLAEVAAAGDTAEGPMTSAAMTNDQGPKAVEVVAGGQ